MTRYDNDSLGVRMKGYENIYKTRLMAGVPVVIRLDMRAGHSFCRHMERPFDQVFSLSMQGATEMLVEQVPGTRLAYCQSDEISIVINDETRDGNRCLFEGQVEKLTSVCASIATLGFNKTFNETIETFEAAGEDMSVYRNKMWSAQFDARAFNLFSVEEVRNYLLWRVFDARRNSVSMIGRSMFSQKELNHKSCEEVAEMLNGTGRPLDTWSRRNRFGFMLLRYAYDKEAVNPKTGETSVVERHGWKTFEFDVEDITQSFIDDVWAGAYMRWVESE